MNTTSNAPRSHEQAAVNPNAGLLLFSWLVVGVPLAWGVIQTIIKSLALFQVGQ